MSGLVLSSSARGTTAPSREYAPSQYVVALAGNPNSGKTTLFNALTGLKYKVANYPGVTVEKRQGKMTIDEEVQVMLIDLPGIYSLSYLSIDERIATNVLLNQSGTDPAPDVVVVVVDSTNLERNLYLVTQLIDCGLPLIIALNMSDLARERGITIHKEVLARAFDVPVVAISASKREGLEQLTAELKTLLESKRVSSKQFSWLPAQCPFHAEAERIGEHLTAENASLPKSSKLFLGSGLLSETVVLPHTGAHEIVEQSRQRLAKAGIDSFTFEATSRYQWINSIIRRAAVVKPAGRRTVSQRLDELTTHRLWGTLIFFVLMGLMFQAIFLWAHLPMDLLSGGCTWLGEYVGSLLPEGALRSLLVDGIIAGVGSVIVFIPQIAILFLFLGLLEDSGYLSRAAFLMDKLLRRVGLQGRSFIPLLSSFACAIPGIMSTRTIPSWADRIATILVAPLMSCSARIPVYTVLIAAFIPARVYAGFISLQGLVLFALYLMGILGACLVARVLKHSLLKGKPALFVMEMPPFRQPSLKTVLRQIWDNIYVFIRHAGTIILASSIVLWFLASYPKTDSSDTSMQVKESYAGRIGTFIEPAIKPLGFNWEIGVGILTSFAAREVFISTLATVYNLQDASADSETLVEKLKQKRDFGAFSVPTALSLMVFYVFACQCMSTLAVCKRETGSWGWAFLMFAYMSVIAYSCSFIVYRSALFFLGA